MGDEYPELQEMSSKFSSLKELGVCCRVFLKDLAHYFMNPMISDLEPVRQKWNRQLSRFASVIQGFVDRLLKGNLLETEWVALPYWCFLTITMLVFNVPMFWTLPLEESVPFQDNPDWKGSLPPGVTASGLKCISLENIGCIAVDIDIGRCIAIQA